MKSLAREKKPDLILLLVTLLLVTIGTVMIYSSSSILATEKFHDGQFFLKKQIFFLCPRPADHGPDHQNPLLQAPETGLARHRGIGYPPVRALDPSSGDPRRRRRPLAQPRGLLLPGLGDGQGRPDPLSGPFPDGEGQPCPGVPRGDPDPPRRHGAPGRPDPAPARFRHDRHHRRHRLPDDLPGRRPDRPPGAASSRCSSPWPSGFSSTRATAWPG